MLNKILFVVIAILLVFIVLKCDLFNRDYLSEVENSSYKLNKCEALKNNDCSHIKIRLRKISQNIKMETNPPTRKQLKAAVKLGEIKAQEELDKYKP